MLPNLVENTKQTYVLLVLVDSIYTTTNFDLWMSKGAHNVFDWLWISWEKIAFQNTLELANLKHLQHQGKHL
jgi:hypothetical protein